MILSTYLQKHGLTYESFGKMIGVTPTSIYRYAKGDRFPRRHILARIEEETKGATTFEDFMKEEVQRNRTTKKGHRP